MIFVLIISKYILYVKENSLYYVSCITILFILYFDIITNNCAIYEQKKVDKKTNYNINYIKIIL